MSAPVVVIHVVEIVDRVAARARVAGLLCANFAAHKLEISSGVLQRTLRFAQLHDRKSLADDNSTHIYHTTTSMAPQRVLML